MEIWADIEGYEGLYQVSNQGRVKSLARETIGNDGRKYPFKETILKPRFMNAGYLIVNIHKERKMKSVSIHRLVAETLIPNPENKREVNHINGNKTDNRIENIEWCTSSENKTHAITTGLNTKPPTHYGEDNFRTKLNKYNVQHIRGMYAEGTHTHRQLADMFGVTRKNIGYIINRKTWADIPDL